MRVLQIFGIALFASASVFTQASLPQSLNQIDRHFDASAEAARSADRSAAEAQLQTQVDLLRLQIRAISLDDPNWEKAQRMLALAEQVLSKPDSIAFDTGLPTPVSVQRGTSTLGSSCATAIPLLAGQAMSMPVSASESLWFRVDMPNPHGLRLSTRGSTITVSIG